MKRHVYPLLVILLFQVYSPPSLADSPSDWVTEGKVFGEVRYRYEQVTQDGLAQDASANTIRGNIGFETGVYKDLKGLIEIQAIRHLGNDGFNDTTNGKITYPVVADPESTEFNQGWISWSGLPNTELKIGRQKIVLDNQRFVGPVGWRQNDQTFDAGTVIFNPLENLNISYSYLWNINRVFGEHSPLPDYTGDNHLIHSTYTFRNWLKVAAYGYFLDIEQTPALSSNTFGSQLTGNIKLSDDWKFQYLAEYAYQRDGDDNPVSLSESYFHLNAGLSWKTLTISGGVESLGGNGVNAFQTPLATGHAFNGWADKFLVTPVGGLEDAYGGVSYKLEGIGNLVDGIKADVIYHDFKAENSSMNYGTEWDFQIGKTFKIDSIVLKEWTISAKYADYNTDGFLTDTNKFWLMMGIKF